MGNKLPIPELKSFEVALPTPIPALFLPEEMKCSRKLHFPTRMLNDDKLAAYIQTVSTPDLSSPPPDPNT